jgi:hypothetical protein
MSSGTEDNTALQQIAELLIIAPPREKTKTTSKISVKILKVPAPVGDVNGIRAEGPVISIAEDLLIGFC